MKQLSIPGTRRFSGRARLPADESLRQLARQNRGYVNPKTLETIALADIARNAPMAVNTATIATQLDDRRRELRQAKERLVALDQEAQAWVQEKNALRVDLVRQVHRLEGAITALCVAMGAPIEMEPPPAAPVLVETNQ